MKTRLTITIEESTLEDFRKLCKKEGFKMSTKIERLVEDFIEKRGK